MGMGVQFRTRGAKRSVTGALGLGRGREDGKGASPALWFGKGP